MAKPAVDLPRLDPRSLPGPHDVARWQMANGMVVLLRENHASPSVVVQGFLGSGAMEEDPTNAGRASLTASALLRGTQRQTFEEIYDSMEAIGASLRFGAGKHHTSFQGKALAEDLDFLLRLLAEALRQPTFPADPLERLRAERLTALDIRDQDTGAVAGLGFDRLAYPGHPYAIPSDGTKDSVTRMTRDQIVEFHARAYGPRNMVLAVVGAVNRRQVETAVEQALGEWTVAGQRPSATSGEAPPLPGVVRTEAALEGKSQCDLVVGVPGPPRTDPAYLACAVGNNILGRFGLYGRIGDAVRERAGLAYYAYSSLGGGPGPGPWTVTAGVNPSNVELALELIRKEIHRFVSRPVTPVELAENQAHFIGRLPLQLESNEGVASALIHLEQYDLGLDYYQTFADRVAALRRDQLLAAAQRFLSADRLAVSVAGPALPQADP